MTSRIRKKNALMLLL